MQAILVKYLPPTSTRGSRLKAKAMSGSATVGLNHAMEIEDQARELALKLAMHYWKIDKLTGFGTLANGDFVATIGV